MKALKKKYIEKLVKAEFLGGFAITEPDAGSDAANIRTSAVLEGDHWVLNGNKVFITNADQARIFTVIALTDETKRASGGVTAFIVEQGMPGFTVGAADVKMGLKGSHTHELVFKDCRVPRDNGSGGMEKVGQGFRTAMKVLDKGRLSMGACALGASRKVMQVCGEHLKRKLAAGRARPHVARCCAGPPAPSWPWAWRPPSWGFSLRNPTAICVSTGSGRR